MITFLIIIHVIICVGLVIAVLMQTGKGGLDSNFGGIATNALGTQSASTMIKNATKILFAAFVISCLILAAQVRRTTGGGTPSSRLQREMQREAESMQAIDPQMDFEPQFSTEPIEVQIPPEGQEAPPFEIIFD